MTREINTNGATAKAPIFTMSGRGWIAKGQVRGDGFVVFEGSTVCRISPSLERTAKTYYTTRIQCEADKVIVENRFTHDFEFESVALAASVVCGRLPNVNNQLKTDKGKTFGQCYAKRHGERKRDLVIADWDDQPQAPLGYSTMPDGTIRHVRREGSKTIEVRGNLASQVMMAANYNTRYTSMGDTEMKTTDETTTRFFGPIYDWTLKYIDGMAKANATTRGETLERLIETAAKANGIELTDAPMHRDGRTVVCDPDTPDVRNETKRNDGTTLTLLVYADIDGKHGSAFRQLQAKWKTREVEETIDRLVNLYAKKLVNAA